MLRELLGKYPQPPLLVGRLEAVATGKVSAGIGLKMLVAQAANEGIRHCRIGKIVEKGK